MIAAAALCRRGEDWRMESAEPGSDRSATDAARRTARAETHSAGVDSTPLRSGEQRCTRDRILDTLQWRGRPTHRSPVLLCRSGRPWWCQPRERINRTALPLASFGPFSGSHLHAPRTNQFVATSKLVSAAVATFWNVCPTRWTERGRAAMRRTTASSVRAPRAC